MDWLRCSLYYGYGNPAGIDGGMGWRGDGIEAQGVERVIPMILIGEAKSCSVIDTTGLTNKFKIAKKMKLHRNSIMKKLKNEK